MNDKMSLRHLVLPEGKEMLRKRMRICQKDMEANLRAFPSAKSETI